MVPGSDPTKLSVDPEAILVAEKLHQIGDSNSPLFWSDLCLDKGVHFNLKDGALKLKIKRATASLPHDLIGNLLVSHILMRLGVERL